MTVNITPRMGKFWFRYLAVLRQNTGRNLAGPLDELNDRTIAQLGTNVTELLERSESRIRVAEDTMAVSTSLNH